jgi:hypothetical protein
MSKASTGGRCSAGSADFAKTRAIWGVDGQSTTFSIRARCGCELGYEDCSPEGASAPSGAMDRQQRDVV